MRLDDLLDVLEEDAQLAPDGAGLVQAAEAGARHRRQRRRVVTVGAAAALVLAAAAVTPMAVRLEGRRPVTPGAPADRQPRAITLTVAPGAGWSVFNKQVGGNHQALSVSAPDPTGPSGLQFLVEAWDPGPADLRRPAKIERTQVQGRPAEYWTYPVDNTSARHSPTLLWQDPSGLRIEVTQVVGNDPAAVARLADAVRIGPPQPIKVPFQLPSVPPTLRLSMVSVPQAHPYLDGAEVILGPPGSPPASILQITMAAKSPIHRPPGTPEVAAVAGHRAYSDFGKKADTHSLILVVGDCYAMFHTVGLDLSEAQVRDLAARTRYSADCTDRTTWTTPVAS